MISTREGYVAAMERAHQRAETAHEQSNSDEEAEEWDVILDAIATHGRALCPLTPWKDYE